MAGNNHDFGRVNFVHPVIRRMRSCSQPEQLSWNHGWTLMNADKASQKPDIHGFRQ